MLKTKFRYVGITFSLLITTCILAFSGYLSNVVKADSATADGYAITDTQGTFASGKQALPLYTLENNSKLVKSGKTLNVDFSQYQSFGYAKDKDETIYAINLGSSQWVKPGDKFSTPVTYGADIDLGRQAIKTEKLSDGSYDSFAWPLKIYSDAAATQDTGQTLATNNSDWSVTTTGVNNMGNVVTYDLGDNQWVSDRQNVNAGYQTAVAKPGYILGVFSNNESLPLYKDAGLTTPSGQLNTNGSLWQVQSSWVNTWGSAHSYALGNQQWIYAKDVTEIPSSKTFQNGTVTYNTNGKATGTLSHDDTYQVFDAKNIHNRIFLKLGNDNQWVDFQS
ncbi:hypothetical protein FC83_GL002925 [Agrilactobacillus composti DSM 18527 = JCM 14202]|uniref:Surface layer protein A domain-containing protein n=1 Tax=Agrilactobacillus composti DSM 18527 = JCM 14202 TaxID=1423734 RepID=X0QTY2_9LACO|nr:hypothetical protein [Agrilactobacillus composti]KRM33357.1 hypothetical protein FC83_GL002925 [Agrilactobacillus composti DSM 18527 = JCM 14202]GAF42050.1 hypothetical protein JCM14202_4048 [Agrilactobacillus composti DSM 18527 = JCM 14202]